MKYTIEEIIHPVGEHNSWKSWNVLDENGVKQNKEAILSPYDAEFLLRKLTENKPERDPMKADVAMLNAWINAEKPSSDEPDMAFFEKLYGSDPSNEKLLSANSANQPAKAPEPISQREIIIESEEAVGSIIEYNNQQWIVTQADCIGSADAADAEDGFDVFLSPGWHSTLVRLDPQVMTVLAEQYADGQATFPCSNRVQFPDEQSSISVFDLLYSQEIGLYDQTKITPEKRHGGPRLGAGRPPAGTPTKLGTQEQLVVYARAIAVHRSYSDLVNGLQPLQRLRDKYFDEIAEFKDALVHKTWLHALHESSDTLYYAACIDAQSGGNIYADALRESAQLLRFHGIRVSSKQIEAAALAKYAWRADDKDNKDEAHELMLIEQAVGKRL